MIPLLLSSLKAILTYDVMSFYTAKKVIYSTICLILVFSGAHFVGEQIDNVNTRILDFLMHLE
jgi:hypothetical protein